MVQNGNISNLSLSQIIVCATTNSSYFKGRCFTKLGSHLVARRCFEKAQDSCNKHVTDKTKLAKVLDEIRGDIASLNSCPVMEMEEEEEESLVPLPNHAHPNPLYPALSSKLEVRHRNINRKKSPFDPLDAFGSLGPFACLWSLRSLWSLWCLWSL